MDSISERASANTRRGRREPKKPTLVAMAKVGNGWQRIGAAWSFKSGEEGLSVQINALPLNWDGRFSLFTPQEVPADEATDE
jgi:hypothetical protein